VSTYYEGGGTPRAIHEAMLSWLLEPLEPLRLSEPLLLLPPPPSAPSPAVGSFDGDAGAPPACARGAGAMPPPPQSAGARPACDGARQGAAGRRFVSQ